MEPKGVAVFWDADLEVFVVLGDDDEPVGVGITAEDAVREAESALQPVEWDQCGGQWVVFDAHGFLLGSSYDSPEDARQDAVDRARSIRVTRYKITSSEGVPMGTYEASSPDAALDAMARAAGYGSEREAAAVVGAPFQGVVEDVETAVRYGYEEGLD